jgi:hypothetical protein
VIEHTRPPQFGGGFRFLGPPIHPSAEGMKYPPGILARLGAGGGGGFPHPSGIAQHPLLALLAQFHQQ